ncbi:Bro-N domain-containing protein, partial [Cloacibacillus evryensis]|uniref:BRO-N domain-containing protein n=1 Tax=Cloacibacillus evryensis TaxID=508460 RepID=UPI003AB5A759
MSDKIALFENKKIRSVWMEAEEEWYFSVVDIVSALTGSIDGRKYWNKLKQRLKEEGNETVTNYHQLKLQAADGKMRLTDVASTENILRLIQSIPSPKAEPFKLWLARVGAERIEETADPELAIDRAFETYLKKGYTKEWIHQRLLSIRIRSDLTTKWDTRGVKKDMEYAILTSSTTEIKWTVPQDLNFSLRYGLWYCDVLNYVKLHCTVSY